MTSLLARARARSAFAPLSLLVLSTAFTAPACSSTTEDASAPAPAPAVLEWVDRPAADVSADEGRSVMLPVTVRTSDVAKLTLAAVGEGGVESEIVRDDTAAADGLWHGKLHVMVGYGAAKTAALRIDLDDGAGKTASIPVALASRPLVWKKRIAWTKGSGPQTREHGVFVVDEGARAAFLFQGSGYDPQWKPIEDSWRLDLATKTWTSWTPTGDVPSARAAHRAAIVPGTTIAYVYGGYTGFGGTEKSESDLHRLDVANSTKSFTKLTNVGAAMPRQLHSIAFDAKGERLVVFGGFTDVPVQNALDDTWLVNVAGDTATWTKIETKVAPSPRYGFFNAFDAESRRFVVWSGGQMPESDQDPVNAAQDAWGLDVSVDPPVWSKIVAKGEAPKGRRNGCSMHDPVGRRLFVYGGTLNGRTTEPGLYALDLTPGREAWSKVDLANAPPIRSSGFGFATAAGDVSCAFGNGTSDYADVNMLGYE